MSFPIIPCTSKEERITLFTFLTTLGYVMFPGSAEEPLTPQGMEDRWSFKSWPHVCESNRKLPNLSCDYDRPEMTQEEGISKAIELSNINNGWKK